MTADDRDTQALLIGGALVLTLGFVELLAVAGFAAGAPISWWQLPAAVLLAGGWQALAARKLGAAPRTLVTSVASFLAVLLGGVLVAGLVFDLSYDGQTYHQAAIVALGQGWNALGPPLTDADTAHSGWLNVYAKGPWLVASSIRAVTGRMQQAKAANLWLVAAALLLVLAAVAPLFRQRRGAWGLALLAALNPVTLVQALTFYVDGQLASLLTILLALAALSLRTPARATLPVVAAALIALANIKFTGLVYAVLFGGAVVLAPVAAKGMGALLEGRRALPWVAGGVAAGALLVG
ncbi:MAG: hypothetical protein ACK4N5_17810, partial [Myxococcales bacterium]